MKAFKIALLVPALLVLGPLFGAGSSSAHAQGYGYGPGYYQPYVPVVPVYPYYAPGVGFIPPMNGIHYGVTINGGGRYGPPWSISTANDMMPGGRTYIRNVYRTPALSVWTSNGPWR